MRRRIVRGWAPLLLGATTFCSIYFFSVLGGSLLSLFIHRHHDYRALGASGAWAGASTPNNKVGETIARICAVAGVDLEGALG